MSDDISCVVALFSDQPAHLFKQHDFPVSQQPHCTHFYSHYGVRWCRKGKTHTLWLDVLHTLMIVGQLKPHVVRAAITFNSRANHKHRRNIINSPVCQRACDGNFDRSQWSKYNDKHGGDNDDNWLQFSSLKYECTALTNMIRVIDIYM